MPAHSGPLRPPYEGPFPVLEAGVKHFVVDMGGHDRLKLAHLDVAKPIELAQPPRRGRPPGLTAPPPACPSGAPPFQAPPLLYGEVPRTVPAV